eukprot:scaffold122741_cov60-Phaeocystis_antarctica.AAC.2
MRNGNAPGTVRHGAAREMQLWLCSGSEATARARGRIPGALPVRACECALPVRLVQGLAGTDNPYDGCVRPQT